MSGEVETYLTARRDFELVRAEIMQASEFIIGVGTLLRSEPDGFSFSNTEVGLPTIPGKSVNGDNWPSAKQLQELLAKYHAGQSSVRQAWAAVPSDIRPGLQPLPNGAETPAARRYGR